TSRTFSMNCGSRDSFQLCCRCGCSPKARQIRETELCDIPSSAAKDLVDQCVASFGVVSSVRTITSSTCPSLPVPAPPPTPSPHTRPHDRVLPHPPPPPPPRPHTHPEPPPDLGVIQPFRGRKHNPRPLRQRLRTRTTPRPRPQLLPLLATENQLNRSWTWHQPS